MCHLKKIDMRILRGSLIIYRKLFIQNIATKWFLMARKIKMKFVSFYQKKGIRVLRPCCEWVNYEPVSSDVCMSLARNLQVIGEGYGGDMDRPTDIELRLLANKRSELVYMPLLLKTLESSYSCFDRLSIRNK